MFCGFFDIDLVNI
ncbi:hypothetical protein ECEC4402_0058, partial [Escherichia coli EC4402]